MDTDKDRMEEEPKDEKPEGPKEDIEKKAPGAGAKKILKEAADKAKEKLDEAGEKARHKLGETGEKAKERLDEAGEKAREARDKANLKIKEAREKGKHKLEESGAKAREKLDEAGEKAKEARQRTMEGLGKAGSKTKDAGKKLFDLLADGIKRIGESHWFRSIHMKTWAGVALTLVYFFFVYFEQLNYRWWVMLPLGAAGLYVLGSQWFWSADRKGVDARVCLVAFVVLALLVIYRDALLSEMMLDRMEAVKGIKEVFE